MTPQDPTPEPASVEPRPQAARHARTFLRCAVAAALATIVWLVTRLAFAGSAPVGAWALNLIIPSASVLLFALVVLRQQQTWVWPVRKMSRLLPQIRAGELPIDSLSDIDGGLKDLAVQMQSILIELRQQKARTAEMNAEMRDRVANRTDALQRQIGSLRQQAVRDALTGLYNRRMLDQFLPQAIEKCREHKVDLSLLMIDIDHFKLLNDTLGHAHGDELLRDIGQIIRSTIREADAAFRCGGDEFVVLLLGSDAPAADVLAQRLNSLVMELTRMLKLPNQPRLSIGIATLSKLRHATPQTLMEEADKRLYEIKSARKALRTPQRLAS